MKTSEELAELTQFNLNQALKHVKDGHLNLATFSFRAAQVGATLAQAAAIRELTEMLDRKCPFVVQSSETKR